MPSFPFSFNRHFEVREKCKHNHTCRDKGLVFCFVLASFPKFITLKCLVASEPPTAALTVELCSLPLVHLMYRRVGHHLYIRLQAISCHCTGVLFIVYFSDCGQQRNLDCLIIKIRLRILHQASGKRSSMADQY